MTPRDQQHLAYWLGTGCSLAEVEAVDKIGIVGNVRFSERARDWFRLIWTWSAPRFEGLAGFKHDRAYAKLGRERYNRRIQRIKQLGERLCQS